ncbi:MAG: alpha-ketoacid dehydrogenase subunit beta [Actinobacteria bacterium]|nr:alpha-ketoacid dehydrogenase subunit beta [Actinomycetota bacterium]
MELTYAAAIATAIDEEMARDSDVFMFGEDVGLQGGVFRTSEGLQKKYGASRVLDTPISEGALAGLAVGAAITGLRPIVEIMYIDFITIAMDQIVNQAAKIKYMFGGKVKVPLVLLTQGGAGRGNAGHHSQSFESWFVHVPGLKVVQPSNAYDAKGLMKTAIRDDNAVIFISHKLLFNTKSDIPEAEYLIPFGKANLVREGEDITIIATSNMVSKALEAADILAQSNVYAEVIDPRTLYPLDMEAICSSIKKTSNVVIVHESARRAGIGAEISSRIVQDAFDLLDAPVEIIGGLDTPIPYSQALEFEVIPSVEKIVNVVKRMLRV